jgi:hypothetical protein
LYRHAKKANLPVVLRKEIRREARTIVADSNFTPERIRKLVKEVLPRFATNTIGEQEAHDLRLEIARVIANPTERSRTTFRALPISHKWVLISILELGTTAYLKETCETYARFCPGEDQQSFDSIVDQLTESFIKRKRVTNPYEENKDGTEVLTWIHPSYRDLVIDELIREPLLSNRFLMFAAMPGITLAVSSGGGKYGERDLPFLTTDHAWELLKKRCTHLATTIDAREIPDLLETLSSSVLEATTEETRQRLEGVASGVCESVRRRWDDTKRALNDEELNAYTNATALISPLPAMPDLRATWAEARGRFLDEIKWSEHNEYFFPDEVVGFLKIAKTIANAEPRFLRQNGFPDQYQSEFDRVFELARSESDAELSEDTLENIHTDIYRLKALQDLVKTISQITPELSKQSGPLLEKLAAKVVEADAAAEELEGPEPEYDRENTSPSEDDLDLDRLFSDL